LPEGVHKNPMKNDEKIVAFPLFAKFYKYPRAQVSKLGEINTHSYTINLWTQKVSVILLHEQKSGTWEL
jgi:hypothetical protein